MKYQKIPMRADMEAEIDCLEEEYESLLKENAKLEKQNARLKRYIKRIVKAWNSIGIFDNQETFGEAIRFVLKKMKEE